MSNRFVSLHGKVITWWVGVHNTIRELIITYNNIFLDDIAIL